MFFNATIANVNVIAEKKRKKAFKELLEPPSVWHPGPRQI